MEEYVRCGWSEQSDLERHYHDTQWGIPCHDERELFEMLILEGQQAGLSWNLILKKRDAMRRAFDAFDPHIMKDYDDAWVESMMHNPEIIRNRLKLKALATNAQAYFKVVSEYGSLDSFLWAYVDYVPLVGHWQTLSEIPVRTELSDRLSKDLKKLGFKFVGSTIIYSYMQAVGMIDDHLESCSFKVNRVQ